MPLYKHATTDERVRTVAESTEDERLAASSSWQKVDEGKPQAPAPDEAAEKPAKTAAARGAVTATGGDK